MGAPGVGTSIGFDVGFGCRLLMNEINNGISLSEGLNNFLFFFCSGSP